MLFIAFHHDMCRWYACTNHNNMIDSDEIINASPQLIKTIMPVLLVDHVEYVVV